MDAETYKGWLRFYYKAHSVENPVSYDKERKRRLPLAEGVFEAFIDKVSVILKQSSDYLDKNHVPLPEPLWRYNPDDPTTHMSSPHFAYGHLLQSA